MFANEPPDNQRVIEGEFLICRGNGNKSLVGVGVFASSSMPDTVFPDTIIAGRIDPKKFYPQFFQDVWNAKWIRNQIEKSARTTNGTFKVNQGGLEAIRIPMPDIALQKAYSEKVTLVRQAKTINSNQLNRLSILFSSLQSRAFSGQL
jgi:type I restriction enzyme S subunit